jgi:hypothetical protein
MRNRVRLLLITAALALAAPTVAKPPPVTVGKITSEAPAPPDATRELKAALEREIGGMDLSKARERYVLSASLVTLKTVTEKERVESTCVISAELTRKSGTLRAVLSGKARATDGKHGARAAELAAIQGAARSAVKGLPQALR